MYVAITKRNMGKNSLIINPENVLTPGIPNVERIGRALSQHE